MSDHLQLDENTKALLREPMTMSRYLLYAIVAFILVFIVWANLTEVDERTMAMGKVIPSSSVQEVQNLEGGIVKKIYVHEGEIVNQGQVLLKIDDTQYSANLEQKEVSYYSMMAKKLRLQAESEGLDKLELPSKLLEEYPEIAAHEQALFVANTEQVGSKLITLEKNLTIAKERLAIAEPMVEERIVSRNEFLKLQQEVNELQGKYNDELKVYESEARGQLNEVNSEVKSLEKLLSGYEDTLDRSTIRSPVYGIVKKVNVDTVGGVIEAGEDIMEIVPLDDQLQIEARVNPKDIAFIRAGQDASISITAYDPSIYGYIDGKVAYVSADAITDNNDEGKPETYYKVIVQTKTNHINYHDNELPIIPGMQTSVSILTGKKSIMDYILKPILKVRQEALRER